MNIEDEFDSEFKKLVVQQAELNVRISEARFRPADPSLEKPKDIVSVFMIDIAERTIKKIPDARYVKSRRTIKVQHDDLTFCFYFQSMPTNTAGISVQLIPHLEVSSKKLKNWRKNHPDPRGTGTRDSGRFVFGMLSKFIGLKGLYQLELVDQKNRSRLAADVSTHILHMDELLYPILSDLENLIEYASTDKNNCEVPSDYICEYVSCNWGKETVQQYVQKITSQSHEKYDQLFQLISDYPQTKDRVFSRVSRLESVARYYVANNLVLS